MTAWTNREIARLRRQYAGMPRARLAKEFAPHSLTAILTMAWRLGLMPKKRDWRAIAEAHALSPSFNFSKMGGGVE